MRVWPLAVVLAFVSPALSLAFELRPHEGVAFVADTNRDGILSEADRSTSDEWHWSRGAFVPVNNDDDDHDGERDGEDRVINGENDKSDFATIDLHIHSRYHGAEILFDLNHAALPFVTLFQKQEDTWHPVSLNHASGIEAQETIHLTMEASEYAHADWDGTITLHALVRQNNRILDTAHLSLRVVPWLMSANTAPVTDLFVRERGERNAMFIQELKQHGDTLGFDVHVAPRSDLWQEMWMQDTMEIGYSQHPVSAGIHTQPAVLKANRQSDPVEVDGFARTLLAPDFGWLSYGESRNLSYPDPDAWVDWYGNLEVTPPLPGYPLGRIYYGDSGAKTMHPDIAAFLDAQELQGPAFRIDTSWLMIRHVDEIISFVEARDGTPYVLIVWPQAALDLLQSTLAEGHGNAVLNYGLNSQTTVASILNNATFVQYNQSLETDYLAVLIDQMQKELGLSDEQFIRIPVLFDYAGDAWTPNVVNSLFTRGTVLASNPRGPVIDGTDRFQEAIRNALDPFGVDIAFLDDVYYHQNKGNTHCGTNTVRLPLRSPFWHALPIHRLEPEPLQEEFSMSVELPDTIQQHIQNGMYTQAINAILALADQSDTPEAYQWEAERLRRIANDYRLTTEQAFELLQNRIEDVTRDEFDQWISEGRFDWRMIEGEPRFMRSTISNLYFRYPEIRARWSRQDTQRFQELVEDVVDHALVFSEAPHEIAAPRTYTIRFTLTVDEDAVPAGETIRCWLPFPQETSFQTNVELLSATPEPVTIAPADAEQRSVYFEQPAASDGPTMFTMDYTFTVQTRYNTIDPEAITTFIPADVERFTHEAPHVQFTPELQALTQDIVGDETSPWHKAKLIYDWMANNLHYSFAREYSTLTNISQGVYEQRYGDCGQLTLFFITLCRIAGVPARWESGWQIYPGFNNLHDWANIYVHPHGWVPVDPNYGMAIYSHSDTLSPETQKQVHDFYFGSISPYRLVANSNHSTPHTPDKRYPRSDTVDSQRGEVEWSGGNLYYNDFRYSLEILSSEPIMPDAP